MHRFLLHLRRWFSCQHLALPCGQWEPRRLVSWAMAGVDKDGWEQAGSWQAWVTEVEDSKEGMA